MNRVAVLAGAASVALLVTALALSTGPLGVGLIDLSSAAIGSGPADAATALALRGPRALAALAVGAALGASGACYQILFRNPLAAPDLLGVSNGAATGAALALLAGAGFLAAQGAALLGGAAAVTVTVLVARAARAGDQGAALILCGLVTAALASAALSLVLYLADPYEELPTVTYWLLGSLARAELPDATAAAAVAGAVTLGLALAGWRLDALTLGDEQARSLGLPAGRWRLAAVAAATALTASAVAVAGVVGWVGLLAPHAARLTVGVQGRWLIPAAALFGAALTGGVDLLARSLGPVEIPLGVLTAGVGAPAFLALFIRQGRRS